VRTVGLCRLPRLLPEHVSEELVVLPLTIIALAMNKRRGGHTVSNARRG